MATALPYIGAAASIGGTLLSMRGQQQQSRAASKAAAQSAANEKVAAEFEAKQADYLASQAIAISHREAYEHRKAAALLASKALANAAASGAGASDQTVVQLINEIQAEGLYRSALAMYEGEENARSYTVAGQARRLGGSSAAAARIAEGQSIAKASNLNMFSTLLSGTASFAKNYGSLFGSAS